MAEVIIEVKNLEKQYMKQKAVDDVSFQIIYKGTSEEELARACSRMSL